MLKKLLIPASIGRSNKDYVEVSRIGSGAFGPIYKCHHRNDPDHLVAKKEIHFSSVRPFSERDLTEEANILYKASGHKNVINYIHHEITPDDNLLLFVEYCDTDLGQFMTHAVDRNTMKASGLFLNMCRQLADGVNFIHSRRIVHMNICSTSVLVKTTTWDGQPLIKISGFTFAFKLSSKKPKRLTSNNRRRGMRYFIAPEIFKLEKMQTRGKDEFDKFRAYVLRHQFALDIFSLGGLYFWMIVGRTPFNHFSMAHGQFDVERVTAVLTHPSEAGFLMRLMLSPEPKERPKARIVRDMIDIVLNKGIHLSALNSDFNDCSGNEKDVKGRTALHLASTLGYADKVVILIDTGADVDSKDRRGRTPLLVAAENDNAECLRILLEKGANINDKDLDDRSALHYACNNESEETIETLIKAGAAIDAVDSEHKTPLHLALENYDVKIADLLIRNGADFGFKDPNERTIFHRICLQGDVDVIELILKKFPVAKIDTRCKDGKTLIEETLSMNLNDVSNILFRHTSKDVSMWHSHMDLLARNGLHEIIEEILNTCPDDFNCGELVQSKLPSPLYLAADHDHAAAAEVILNHSDKCGIDLIDLTCPDLTTAPIIAVLKENWNVIEVFKKRMNQKKFKKLCETYSVQCNKHGIWETLNPKRSFLLFGEYRKKRSKLYDWYINLCKTVPRFNESVVKNNAISTNDFIGVDDIKANILGRLCPLKLADTRSKRKLLLREILVQDCDENCGKKESCEIIRNLIVTCQRLEVELNSSMDGLARLKPEFILVGSVPEGTRIGKADELDILVNFDALTSSFPLFIGANAMELVAAEPSSDSPLRDFLDEEGSFCVQDFFAQFLMSVAKALGKVKMSGSLKLPERSDASCDNCKDNRPFHCPECLQAISHTKCGACVAFLWNDELRIFIDFVPLLPIKCAEGILHLFNSVSGTLLRERPLGWLNYLRKFFKQDRILPDQLVSVLEEQSSNGTFPVGLKMINECGEFIIRPGQKLSIESLHLNEQLRMVYIWIKCIKEMLQLDEIKNFHLKKRSFWVSIFNARFKRRNRSGDAKTERSWNWSSEL